MFKKILLISTMLVSMIATAASAVEAKEAQLNNTDKPTLKQVVTRNRAKIVNMTVELELPDGSIMTVDNMDFCTPGGFYNGVEALVFGDDAVKIMQAGMAALYPKVGNGVDDMWQTKSDADDPRLPTYLMIRAPESKNALAMANGKQGAAKPTVSFGSSAKILKIDEQTPIVMATCGGYNHPGELLAKMQYAEMDK